MRTAPWLLAILVAATAAAQVHEQVTVELVEVPVYVIGPNGQPVRGLTKDSFKLRVSGHDQPIEYFDAIDFATPAASKTEEPSSVRRAPRERRLYLLLFDAAYSVPGFLARAQKAAAYAVDHSNPGTDLFAVATYTTNSGVQFDTPFLTDRAALHRAIGTLSIADARDPLAIVMSPGERTDWVAGGKFSEETLDQIRGSAVNQDIEKQPSSYRVEDLLGNLADLAKRLGALEGQKHVLYLSTGFDAALLHGGASPTPGAGAGGGLDAHALHALDEMFGAFRSAGVFLDAIDIAGQRSKWDNTTTMTKVPEATVQNPANASVDRQVALEVNDSLRIVAEGTGGVFVHDRNDLGNAIADVQTVQQVVYILGFNRRGAKGGEISVHVSGAPRGSRVSYRQGFGSAQRETDVDPLRLADILINDAPQSGLTLPIRANGAEVEVAIPTDQVVAQISDKNPYVLLMLYVFDAHGSAVAGAQKRIRFNDELKNAPGPIVIRKVFDLPPGRYVAKAIARIEGTASLGFAKTNLTVE